MLLTQNTVFVVVTSQQFNNHILLPSFASRLAVTYTWPHNKSIRLVSGALDCKPAQWYMSLDTLVDFKIRHGFCFTSELFLDSLNVFSVLYYALVPAWQWFYIQRRCEKIRRLGRCETKAQHQRCYAGTVTLMRTSVTRKTLSSWCQSGFSLSAASECGPRHFFSFRRRKGGVAVLLRKTILLQRWVG